MMSLLAGVPVNGKGWWGIAQIEFLILPLSLYNNLKWLNVILYVVLICCHLIILTLPFIKSRKGFSLLLMTAPLIYIITFAVLAGPLALLSVPFGLLWLISLMIFFQNRQYNI